MPTSPVSPAAAVPETLPLSEVEATLERAGRAEELLKLYEGRAEEVAQPEEAAHLLSRAGALAVDRLRNPARAEGLFRRALAISPSSREALFGLKGLYDQRQELGPLAEVFERLGASAHGAEAANYFLRAADLHDRLQHRERAILCCQKASRAAPTERAAFQRARTIYLAEGLYQAVLDSLERERKLQGSRELVVDYLTLAERLVDDPTEHSLAVDALAAVQAMDSKNARLASVRAELAALEKTWKDRVRALRAASLEERDRKAAARLSLKVAKLLSFFEPSASAKAKEALDRCFLLWPAMPEALRMIERGADKGESVNAAVTQLEKLAVETKDKAGQVDLWVRVGILRLTRLGDRDGALTAFLKAASLEARADAVSLGAELLIEAGAVPQAIAQLEKLLATRDRSAQTLLHLRLAELCRGQPDGAALARKHLEAALKLDPNDAATAFTLAQSYVAEKDGARLEPILEAAVRAPRPAEERARLLELAASLFEAQGQTIKAAEALGAAIKLVPERLEPALTTARRLGALETLAPALKAAALRAQGPAGVALGTAAAKLFQDELSRPEEAAAAWRLVLERDATDGAAREALAVLERPRPSTAEDPRAALEAEAARLEASGAPAHELSSVYERILAAAPDDVTTLKKLGATMATAADWERVALVAERLLALARTSSERREWKGRLAQLYAERLDRRDEAAGLYLALLAEAPEQPGVVASLERLALQGVRAQEISQSLAPLYAQGGDHQRQVASLLVQLASAQKVSAQKDLLALLAETSERRLLDSRAAFEFWLRGLALDPADARFRLEATRLAEDLSAEVEASRALAALARAEVDVPLACSLFVEAAALAESGGAIDEAAAALQGALEKAVDDAGHLDRLSALYLRSGRKLEAEAVLRRRLLIAEQNEKRDLYLQLAALNGELQRPGEAAQALLEALRAGAAESQVRPRLSAFLEQAGKMAELVESLAREISLAETAGDGERASQLSLKRAHVLESSLGDHAEAIRKYAEVLAQRPTDPEALAALERLLGEAETREQAARALVPAYEAIKDHRKLVSALAVIAEVSPDPFERVTCLRRVAAVQAHDLRQLDQAFAALASALRLVPGDPAVRVAAREAAEAADALETFAEVIEELLEGEVGPAAAPLHRELAELYEKKLGNKPSAIRELNAVLALEPKSLDALRAVQRLYRVTDAFGPLCETLELLGAVEPDASEKVAIWREAAVLLEQKLLDKERAVASWRKIAAQDPLDAEAASALDRLYTELDAPQELAFALELRRNQAGEGPQGRELSFRLAQLRQNRLSDPAGALLLYAEVLAQDPAHEGTRAALEGWAQLATPQSAAAAELLDPVLARRGEHARRISLREVRAAHAPPAERARLAAEVRAIYERDLGQPQSAFMAAVRSFSAGDDAAALAPELERLAEKTGSFEELAEIYETCAGDLGEDPKAIPMLRRAAALREELSQPDDAARVWRALLAVSPGDGPALDALSRLYERSQNARSLSEVYAQKAQLSKDPAEKLALLLRAGAAYEASGEDALATSTFEAASHLGQSADALLALERLHAKAHRFEAQAQVLETLAALSAEPGVKKGHLLRRAQLLEKEGHPAEALRGYASVREVDEADPLALGGLERLLQLDATRLEAASRLEPHYRKQGDKRRLVEVLELLPLAPERSTRVNQLSEIANLREGLGQKAQAFAARLRAFAESPENPDVREELERLAADTGSFEELAAAYEDMLERDPPEALATDLWRRLAVLYADRLNRLEPATRAWEEVHRRDPKNPLVLDALSRIYRRTSAFKELAGVMRKQIDAEGNPAAQVTLLFELAHLAEDTLSDPALAAESYFGVLERQPDDASAIKFLERVLSESERYGELATLIEREVSLAEGRGAEEEALDLRVRLGRLKLQRLEDPRGALDALEEVLRRRPGHAGAVGALEEMVRTDNALRAEAANALEPIFAKAGEHLKLVQMLEGRAAGEPVPAQKAVLLRKVAELYSSQMDNPEMAFVAATRALREVPDDERSLELCLFLVEAADAGDELTSLLNDVAAKATSDDARAALYRALGQLQVERGETAEAVRSWKRVLDLRPSDPQALDEVARLFGRLSQWPQLLDVLKRQLMLAEDPSRRAALMLQQAAIQADHVRDPAGALSTLRRVLELKPDEPAALERLTVLCQEQSRWPELADVLSRRVRLAGDRPPAELRFQLAELRETRLLDKFGALELYTELLDEDPRHAGALARVEALVSREPQNQVAVEALLKAYRAVNDLTKLSQLLEARVGVSADAAERKAIYQELASVRQTQAEPELAYLALYKAFHEDPNDAALRHHLERAAETARAYDELAHAYEEELPRIAAARDVADISFKLGQLLDQKLGEPERAIVFYEKARSLDPALSTRVLPALDRLFLATNQYQALTRVLEELIAAAPEPAEKIGLLFRLGQTSQERLDDPDQAAQAYEKILALDPKHLPAARLLEAIYEASGNHDKLYANLKAQRDLVTGPERERILSKMAHVSAEGLSDVGHSIDIYRELLAKNPRNDQAFAALEGLLEKGGRHAELKELLQGRLGHTLDPRELVRLNDRLGRVLYKLLGKAEDAIPFFKAALERDARHRGALEALRDIYLELGKREELVVVLRRLVPLQEGAEGVKGVRILLAETLAQMGRREEALDAARRALEVEPHQVAEMGRVHALFVGLKAMTDAARALELKAQAEVAADDKVAAVETLFQVAELWRSGSGGKPESAGGALLQILDLDPANRRAYEKATELFARVNDWRAYAQVTDRYLPNLVTDEEKIAALRELARVQEQKLGHKDVAFLQVCRAVQLNPSDGSLRQEVERLAADTGSYEELAAVYEEVADNLPRGPLAERLYLVLARVQNDELDDLPAAEASLRKVLDFDPTNTEALASLAAMFEKRGQNKEYVVALEQQLEAAPSTERRKEILREISRVYDERMGDLDRAASALGRALELEPDAQTLDVLISLYRRQKDWPSVASTLLRARDLAPDPVARARIQAEVSRLYEQDLQDDEAAIQGYRQALEFDPANRPSLEALERLYTQHDRPSELLQVYDKQLEVTSDYRERTKILFKSAQLWEERFQNLANADACMESALQIDSQNLQVVRTLERLRKAQGRWDELVGLVDRHINLLDSPDEKAGLLVEMGDIFHQQLKQVDRAVATYHQALELSPTCRPAMHALGTLYERSGNWTFALDMLHREAQVAGQSREGVELFYRMGKINEDMLLDPSSAKACYLEALKVDPSYLPGVRALKGIHEIEKDWVSYEKVLIHEAEKTEEPEAKSRALLEVARYFSESKEDREGAAHWYEEALKLTPDSLEAARPLADYYISKESWEAGEQMLDIVALKMAERAVAEQDPQLGRELCRQLYRLGYVAEKLGNKDKALKSYEKAWHLDATYLPALEGLGNLLVQAKRFDDAHKVYQTILVHHRDDLTDLEVVEIYWQIGDIHLALKNDVRAQTHFEKALAIDPLHEHSLRSLVGLSERGGKFDKAAEYRQRLMQVVDGEQRYEVALQLGKLAQEQLKDAYMAIDAFLAASRLHPEALEVLDALYVLYRETRQGQKAAEVLEKMLAHPGLTSDPTRAKRVWFALGEISRDDLHDAEAAVTAFSRALDLDYRFIEAFSAIEAVLSKKKKWRQLEESYAQMIQRLPKVQETHAARMMLWKALGDLYLKVLKHPESALMAYQVVAAGSPDDAGVQEAYGELAARQEGQEEKAIEAYRKALPQTTNPGKVASALAELAARRKDYDSAYLAAQVVSGLIGEAGEGEREILAKLSPYAKKKEVAQRPLTDRLWQTHLFHPKVRGPISELMAILYEQAGHLYKGDFAQYQVNPKKHLIDVSKAQEYQIHHFRYVAKLLGMENVALYSPFLTATRERMAKKSSDPAPDPLVGVEILHTHPVGLKVGGKFFGETGQKEVYYLLGRTMALLRPELAFSQRLSAERLEAVFQAAISLSVAKFRFSADPKAIDTERRRLEGALPEPARAALARVTGEYVRTSTPNDLRHYLEGAELSAVRTGLFVAGEVEPVKRMVLGESGASHRVQARSKIRDLMVFALSEDLHALRVAVGTHVEVQVRR